jgi:peptidoglycan biosynthesis protein MviN/MurJ (putative lipid II flippase)
MEDKLNALWSEYRDACPDPEGSVEFVPNLWRRIEKQRATSFVFRRLAQVCLLAAVAVTILIAAVIPQLQRLPVYSSTYVDVLAADFTNTYVDILTGDIR